MRGESVDQQIDRFVTVAIITMNSWRARGTEARVGALLMIDDKQCMKNESAQTSTNDVAYQIYRKTDEWLYFRQIWYQTTRRSSTFQSLRIERLWACAD
uniref:Uncharacterized protein n=1 Tax=Globodera rostochiensis TaxID=31243 RepID=A0A914IAV3_GLORO